MKRMMISVVLFCFLVGCTAITYDANTHRFSYFRLGNQKIEDLEVIKDPDIKVNLGSQESKNDEIIVLLNRILSLMEVP